MSNTSKSSIAPKSAKIVAVEDSSDESSSVTNEVALASLDESASENLKGNGANSQSMPREAHHGKENRANQRFQNASKETASKKQPAVIDLCDSEDDDEEQEVVGEENGAANQTVADLVDIAEQHLGRGQPRRAFALLAHVLEHRGDEISSDMKIPFHQKLTDLACDLGIELWFRARNNKLVTKSKKIIIELISQRTASKLAVHIL